MDSFINSYQQEQLDALVIVQSYMQVISGEQKHHLLTMTEEYSRFRKDVDAFQSTYFSLMCTQKCYKDNLSACCSKDGIITFFADVVINVLLSTKEEIKLLNAAIERLNTGLKCIYLGEKGCLWRMKPIVCEMFLCDHAEQQVFEKNPDIRQIWGDFKHREKQFTWPDKPVLFDAIEQIFIDAGYSSSLMYLHNSPGLLRVKQRAAY